MYAIRSYYDLHTAQAAQASKMSAMASLEDYRHQIATEIDNAYLDFSATLSRFESAKMQVKSYNFV